MLSWPVATHGQARPLRHTGWQVFGVLAASRDTHGGVGGALVVGGSRRFRLAASAIGVTSDGGIGGRGEAGLQFHLLTGPRPTWSLYGTGGIGYLVAEGRRGAPFLMLGAGAEHRPTSERSMFLEVGLGEGVRVAVGLRMRTRATRRD